MLMLDQKVSLLKPYSFPKNEIPCDCQANDPVYIYNVCDTQINVKNSGKLLTGFYVTYIYIYPKFQFLPNFFNNVFFLFPINLIMF